MAKAKPNHNVFAKRYNLINQRYPESQQELRELAIEAEHDFVTSKSLYSGFIAASCRFDLGSTEDALEFFRVHLNFITKNQNPMALSIYCHYARMLSYVGEVEQAARELDFFFEILPHNGLLSTLACLEIYGEAKRYDEMWAVVENAKILYPAWENELVHLVMLEYYLSQGDSQGLVECVFDLAYTLDLFDVGLENVNELFDAFRLMLTHPKLHPELTEKEERILGQTYEIFKNFLAQEEAQEANAAAEAERRLNDPTDDIIPFEQVVKNLGLENAI